VRLPLFDFNLASLAQIQPNRNVSAVNDPNNTTIRIEWAFNSQYSAVATRDQNGIFSLNFFCKRQFR
jgi:hypothetical protein